MDKQKQVEEMARDICGNFGVAIENKCGPLNFQCDCKCKWFNIAERCYNAGYRKIPEGSVVLTKEEYDGLKLIASNYYKAVKEVEKKTAEKFAKMLKERAYYVVCDTRCVSVDNIDEICKEITEGKV
jgi:hypothetical protein